MMTYSNKPFPLPLSNTATEGYLKLVSLGDSDAVEKLTEHNLRLVMNIIRGKFFSYTVYDSCSSVDDFMSIGTIGLIKAINTFDFDKECTFSTYATRCIENEILMFLRTRNKKSNTQCISLEEVICKDDTGNNLTIGDVTVSNVSIEDNFTKDEIYKGIREFMKSLTAEQKKIIHMRYELDLSQKAVGKNLGISRSYVSRKERKILNELADYLKKEELFSTKKLTADMLKIKNMKIKDRVLYLANIFVETNMSLDRLAYKYNISKGTILQYFKERLKNIDIELYKNVSSILYEQEIQQKTLKLEKKSSKKINDSFDDLLMNQIKRLIYRLNNPLERDILLHRLGYVDGEFHTELQIAQQFCMREDEIHNIMYTALTNLHNLSTASNCQVLKYVNHSYEKL
jgi:RNA polymerase sporulation-specific sigma factor